MCQALRIQWVNKTNKVPNPQGAYILMWEVKTLNTSTNVFEVVTNFLKIKPGMGVKGDWGM